MVAERYAGARIVAFSTGNVYPRSPVTGALSGAREGDALAPIGEYAASCVGRERVLEHVSRTHFSTLVPFSPYIANQAVAATGVSGEDLNKLLD